MSDTHSGLALRGNFGENEVNWGGFRNEGIASQSHMSYPSLKTITARYQPGTAVDGDMYIVGTGNGWGTFPVDPSNPNASRSTVGHIATRDLSRWYYDRVRPGVIVHVQDTNSLYLYNGTAWQKLDVTAYVPPPPTWYKNRITGEGNRAGTVILGSKPSYFPNSVSSSNPAPFNSVGACQIAGLYQINACVVIAPSSPTQQFYFTLEAVKSSGTRVYICRDIVDYTGSNLHAFSLQVSAAEVLALGDRIDCHLFWNLGGTVRVLGDNIGSTRIDISRIG